MFDWCDCNNPKCTLNHERGTRYVIEDMKDEHYLRGYRDGFLQGHVAGLKVAKDIMDKALMPPFMYIQKEKK